VQRTVVGSSSLVGKEVAPVKIMASNEPFIFFSIASNEPLITMILECGHGGRVGNREYTNVDAM
jgi:hypothetical protein